MKTPKSIRLIRYPLGLICVLFIQNTSALAINPVKQTNQSPCEQRLFSKFWSCFRKAVLAGDSSAVAGMVLYPYTDQYQEIYFKACGGETPLSASSRAAFLTNYHKIFVTPVINAIKGNHYRLPDSNKGEQMGLGKNIFRITYIYIGGTKHEKAAFL